MVTRWPTYPNIGIDNRNEFDMLRFLPGGLPGAKALVDGFHRLGVKASDGRLLQFTFMPASACLDPFLAVSCDSSL